MIDTSQGNAFLRSVSVPGTADSDEENEDENANFQRESSENVTNKPVTALPIGSKVVVHRVDDDETFSNFFKSSSSRMANIGDGVDIADFDAIKSTQRYFVLVWKVLSKILI